MERGKREFLLFGLLPFAALFAAYYVAACFITNHFFKQPQPEPQPGTLAKYTISRAADLAGFRWFKFDLPGEFSDAIRRDAPGFPQRVAVRDYHIILDADGAPHIRFFYVAFPWYLIFSIMAAAVFYFKKASPAAAAESKKDDKFIRGAERVSARQFCDMIQRAIRAEKGDNVAAIVGTDGGALCFSARRLREHLSIFGATGSGKSQFLLSFLASFISRMAEGVRLLVLDRKGEFFGHFSQPGDVLFNPFDARSIKWSIFNEIRVSGTFEDVPPDVQALADLLFPKQKKSGGDPFWTRAANAVFVSALCYCIREGMTTNKKLVAFCNQQPEDVIKAFETLPEGQRAGLSVLPKSGTGTTAGSVLATMSAEIQALSVCEDGDFSIRSWLQNSSGSLYLSAAGKNDSVFIPILQLLLDIAGRDLHEVENENSGGVKYMIIIDELAAYPPLQTLPFLIAEARSKGVAVLLANQTMVKLNEKYGREGAQNLISNTKTKVFFHIGEASDADYISNILGKSEIERVRIQKNENSSVLLGRVDGREGITRTREVTSEYIFMASELQTLPTGCAVVTSPLCAPCAELKFDMFDGKPRTPFFEPIQEDAIEARRFAEIEKKREQEEAAKKEAEKKAAERQEQEEAAEFFRNFKPEPQPDKEDCQPGRSSSKVDEKPEVTKDKEKDHEGGYFL